MTLWQLQPSSFYMYLWLNHMYNSYDIRDNQKWSFTFPFPFPCFDKPLTADEWA
jgi:hypothetical protein